jgi:ATP-dependent RNA helicase DeaD
MLVLDEADEMLDMGFAEDLDAILEATPKARQTALFSATMPPRLRSIAERHLERPQRIQVAREKVAAGRIPRVRQVVYFVPRVTRLRRCSACWTWRAPRRRWCSAARASKSTRWSRP